MMIRPSTKQKYIQVITWDSDSGNRGRPSYKNTHTTMSMACIYTLNSLIRGISDCYFRNRGIFFLNTVNFSWFTLLWPSDAIWQYTSGAVRQQAITWNNVDKDLCCHMASQGHKKLNKQYTFFCKKIPYILHTYFNVYSKQMSYH